MKASQLFISTLREAPSEAEVISHQLMIKAGLIKKVAAGIYNWLPLGLQVLRKVENIVREEMNNAGALEILMPVTQPAELWKESGRLEQYGPELLRFKDRHNRDFCLGPTHEEVVTSLVRDNLSSYKQLPLNLYQIQTKFRDEIRPRFGVMRSREFIMKDAYSFHTSSDCLQETYDHMHSAYCKIFERLNLNYRPVLADGGSIGGNFSHEFHVLADSGEDDIAFSSEGSYAANVEKATYDFPPAYNGEATTKISEVHTPNQQTIEEVASFLNIPLEETVKALVVESDDEANTSGMIMLLVRGDHTLNEIKAEQLPGVKSPLTFVEQNKIETKKNLVSGFIGPVNATIPIIIDHTARAMPTFVCGANKPDYHLTGANWVRDINTENALIEDIRNVVDGDKAPNKEGTLHIKRGIEVGHIFQLGAKYSNALNLKVLNEQGKQTTPLMGCYGIGITRIVAAAIEQNHDDYGIKWPLAMAPFSIHLIGIDYNKNEGVKTLADKLYEDLKSKGIEVLLDNRKERPGVMFNDSDLIGFPIRVVISKKLLEKEQVEIKQRGEESYTVPIDEAIISITSLV